MLSGNKSISTYNRENVCIWMALAFQGGLINIGGLLACHSFVSHVTGFATLFGMKLNEEHYLLALATLMVPFFFLLGSILSGFLIDLRIKLGQGPKYFVIFGILVLLLGFVVLAGVNGFFGPFGSTEEKSGRYLLIAILCLACGIQNGTVTLVSDSVIRTTHLTGVTTDLGIGIVRILNSRQLKEIVSEEGKANLMRIGLIFFFISGSCVGYDLFRRFSYFGFVFPALISTTLFLLTFYFQVLKNHLNPS